MNRLIVIMAVVLALAGSTAGQVCNTGPRGGIDYGANPPAGVQPNPGGQTPPVIDTHEGVGPLRDGELTLRRSGDTASLSSIWGYAHCGWTGLSQAEADTHVDRVEFWLLEDPGGTGTSGNAANVPWTLAHSYVPATTRPDYQPDATQPDYQPAQQYHVTGWQIGEGDDKESWDGTGTAWEGQDVLQGKIAGLKVNTWYFLLIRVVTGGLTNTMPQTKNGRVTGPDEFNPGTLDGGGHYNGDGSTDITRTGNGSAISDWEVVWFKVSDQSHIPATGGGS